MQQRDLEGVDGDVALVGAVPGALPLDQVHDALHAVEDVALLQPCCQLCGALGNRPHPHPAPLRTAAGDQRTLSIHTSAVLTHEISLALHASGHSPFEAVTTQVLVSTEGCDAGAVEKKRRTEDGGEQLGGEVLLGVQGRRHKLGVAQLAAAAQGELLQQALHRLLVHVGVHMAQALPELLRRDVPAPVLVLRGMEEGTSSKWKRGKQFHVHCERRNVQLYTVDIPVPTAVMRHCACCCNTRFHLRVMPARYRVCCVSVKLVVVQNEALTKAMKVARRLPTSSSDRWLATRLSM